MDKQSDQPKFYTTEEVAEILKVTPETIRRYVRTGELRSIKLGGRIIRIGNIDLENFLANLKTKPQKNKLE